MIKFTITKEITNEEYQNELEEYRIITPYMRNGERQQPSRYKTENILETMITEEQFDKIRKVIIDNF